MFLVSFNPNGDLFCQTNLYKTNCLYILQSIFIYSTMHFAYHIFLAITCLVIFVHCQGARGGGARGGGAGFGGGRGKYIYFLS